MPANLVRVDSLLQLALLVAGEEDDQFDRQLGPIHLIKYVYLADLAYAERHGGDTFTGIDWQFHKFGPWSQTVNERIVPALMSIGASQFHFQSDFEGSGEFTRWSHSDVHLLREREQEVPPEIRLKLEPCIRKFGKDTPGLLDLVYRTAPMLSAAPSERLDFKLAYIEREKVDPDHPAMKTDLLSEKKKKKLKERIMAIQQVVASRQAVASNLINPVRNCRYDEVFHDGVTWLDALAGDDLAPGEKIAEFSDDVWKSDARKGRDAS